MDIAEIINDLTSAIQQTSNSRAVFGKPVKLENKTVIPVAEISINLGGGGNLGPQRDDDSMEQNSPKKKTAKSPKTTETKRSGGGAGIMIRTTPVGYLAEKEGEVVFVPIKIHRDSRFKEMAGMVMKGLPQILQNIKGQQ